MHNYDLFCKPLIDILKKRAFSRNPQTQKAFDLLKKAMCQTLILATPDFSQMFVVEYDVCMNGAGVVLMQAGRPLAFYSKAFYPQNMGLSIYEKELLVVVLAVNNWRGYLFGRSFTIKKIKKLSSFY